MGNWMEAPLKDSVLRLLPILLSAAQLTAQAAVEAVAGAIYLRTSWTICTDLMAPREFYRKVFYGKWGDSGPAAAQSQRTHFLPVLLPSTRTDTHQRPKQRRRPYLDL